MKEKGMKMKKSIVSILFVLVAVLFFAGCAVVEDALVGLEPDGDVCESYLIVPDIDIPTVYEMVDEDDGPVRFPVRLARHIDGDTTDFYIDGEIVRVRYIAIDAEERFNCDRCPFYLVGKDLSQCPECGQHDDIASIHVRERLENAVTIALELDPGRDRYCRYGRLLAWVWVDGVLLQEELVALGLAEIAFVQGNELYLYRLEAVA